MFRNNKKVFCKTTNFTINVNKYKTIKLTFKNIFSLKKKFAGNTTTLSFQQSKVKRV